MEITPGTLHIVATPIGNFADLSPRALSILKSVDLILAEDTRHFGRLRQQFAIETPVKSYHDHNERKVAELYLKFLQEGQSIALVSDAGTPTINDPGFHLLNQCHSAGISVRAVPGPSALIAALSVSGFNAQEFYFGGFLPHKGGKRGTCLTDALQRDYVSVFFESPHRLLKTLEQLVGINPDCQVAVCRELTKIFEETYRATAAEALAEFTSRGTVKGEIVLLISPK